MSFLNSVLSSIGAEQRKVGSVSQTQQLARPQSTHPLPSSTPAVSSSMPLKRRADDSLPINGSKIARKEEQKPKGCGPSLNATRPLVTSAQRPQPQTFQAKSSSVGISTQKPLARATQAKPVASGNAVVRPAIQGASAVGVSARPPPKGSYREIMERAQAAKAAQAHVGKIQHKTVAKLTRKERLARAAEAARKSKLGGKHGNHGKHGKQAVSSAGPPTNGQGKISNDDEAKERKKPVDLGYKGTMRSHIANNGYKGTVKPTGSSKPDVKRPAGRAPTSSGPRYTYASYSDEEEEEEEEEEYWSDESDMEAAGFDELEEEEQASLRVAKKEDLEALRQENEHKRLKLERRQKLEQLAAARRR